MVNIHGEAVLLQDCFCSYHVPGALPMYITWIYTRTYFPFNVLLGWQICTDGQAGSVYTHLPTKHPTD
jgi:hypothetical protein